MKERSHGTPPAARTNRAPVLCSDSSLPLVQLSIATGTGSSQDPPGKEGLTRLTTRLMRRTAGGRTSLDVERALDSLGGALGAEVGVSSTSFVGSVLRRSLGEYLDLLSSAVHAPGLSEAEFARLQRETLAELTELRDSDSALVRSWFRRSLFEGHAYGRSTLGSKRTVENMSIEDVRTLTSSLWTQDNIRTAFSGDISADEANSFLSTFQQELPERSPRLPEPGAPSPKPGRHLIFVDKPERTQTQIVIGGLGTHPEDEDHTALLVANTVFGGTFTARLTQEVRAKRGWSYGAHSSLPIDRQRQAFGMWTFPASKDAAACIALKLQLLETWVQDGINAEELEQAKQYLTRSHVFLSDTAAKRMALTMDEQLYDLPSGYYADYPKRVGQITLESANAALKKRISTENLTIVVVGTAADVADEVQKAIPRLQDCRVIPFDRE